MRSLELGEETIRLQSRRDAEGLVSSDIFLLFMVDSSCRCRRIRTYFDFRYNK